LAAIVYRGGLFVEGEDEAFPFELVFVAEVDEITDGGLADAHVVEELGLVLREDLGDGFQFDDDGVEDEKVGDVLLREYMAFVVGKQGLLGSERDCAGGQFDLKTFVINAASLS
jgi:hypothetical protein